MYRIVEKKKLSKESYLLRVEAPLIAKKRKAGQFISLRIDETGERIPLTIVDSDEQTITLIFQEVGKTTAKLGRLEEGEFILDVVGPLGRPTHIEKVGTVVCIGGGIGIAVAYPQAKAFKEAGNKVICIIGARSKELLILEEETKKVSDELRIVTDDGSYGRRGFVTDSLKELIEEKENINLVLAVGPLVMMQAVSELTRPYKLKTMVSLNPIMIDGTGMCGSCRVTVGGETRFVCVHGPEFDGHLVDFDELANRQKMYLKEEKECLGNHPKCSR